MTMLGGSFGLMQMAAKSYATWNPADKGTGITLSGGNLIATFPNAYVSLRATIGKSSGKWYWEYVVGGTVTGPIVGIANSSAPLTTYTGGDANGWAYYGTNGWKYTSGSGTVYGATYAVGNVIGVALDMDAGTVTFYKNGVSQGVAFSGLTGTIYPAAGNTANTPTVTANFGATALTYSPPSGFNAGLYN